MIPRIPAGQGFERITEAVTSDFGSLIDLVSRAVRELLRSTPGCSDYYVSASAIWPDRIVVQVHGRYQSYPYTLDADNRVTLGAPSEVTLNYTPVRESAPAVVPADPDAVLREAEDGSIEVTIARAGLSVNRNFYSDAVLREAVSLFEGVRVFAKSDAEHSKGAGKDVRNLIGGIYGVRFVEGASADTGALVGTFKALSATDAIVVKMTEAVKRGMQSLMGLSLDAEASIKKEKRGGTDVRTAKKFMRVHSVDLIVAPGAGGGLDRLTEAADPDNQPPGATMLKKNMLIALAALSATSAAALTEQSSDSQVVVALTEAANKAGLDVGQVLAAAAADDAQTIETQVKRLVEAANPSRGPGNQADDDQPVTRAELAMHRARSHATLAIAGSTLPQIAKDRLQAEFRARERFTEAEVDTAIKGERDYLARFTESGRPNGGMPRIEVGDRTVVIADMLNAFFDPAHKDHRNVRSIRECYIEITGDRHVTGEVDRARLTESIGTDTFSDVLGNSLTRRIQAAYRDAVAWDAWREVADVTPVSDFRVQERTQMGGFGNLPIVAERGNYTTLADPSDDKATYSVAKRGGLVQVTLETFKNDDVGAIRRLPIEVGRAAKRTLYNFVFNFYSANGAIYDGIALFHASHGNLFTAALSSGEIGVHRLSMMKQTGRDTANRMGIPPALLLVSLDQQEAAVNLFNRSTNNDKTFIQDFAPKIIPVVTWSDANDWVMQADKLDMPVIEIGFLDGNEEPELLVQDNPTSGSVFTNDVLSYKVRHTYGGNVLVDGFKAVTKAVVA